MGFVLWFVPESRLPGKSSFLISAKILEFHFSQNDLAIQFEVNSAKIEVGRK